MASPARRRANEAPLLRPAPPIRQEEPLHDAAERMLGKLGQRIERLTEAVEPYRRINHQGGFLGVDPPTRPYDFGGARHVNVNAHIQANLWRFGLAPLDRGVLDYMVVEHDEDGQVRVRQVDLARYFECSQPRIHKAVKVLRGHHFVWVVRRSLYQVNPHYAYRFSSTQQRALIQRIGRTTLNEHRIEIPGLGRNT